MSLQIHFVTHYNYTPVLYYIHNADFKCLHIIEIFIKPTNQIHPTQYLHKAKGTQMSLQIHFVTPYNYTPVLYYNHNADFKCLHIIEIFIKPTN